MASLLDRIDAPADLRRLPATALPALAAEIRERLISSVRRTGGHLGANLGVVELTIALHRAFDSPHDAIVWDTGHQAYVHKMLTGRRGEFDRLRQSGGLSGYPRRSESPHDLVENSHASTALSYAEGLAKAFALGERSGSSERSGERCGGQCGQRCGGQCGGQCGERCGERSGRAVIAVVGDGALTGGMCWEALNNIAAVPHRPIVIVLNDNGRSYAPTVGVVGAHLSDLRAGAVDGSLFEGLGLAYLGPVDGHDVTATEAALRQARALGRPAVVHCVTCKGRGYPPAEADEADQMHAVNPLPTPGRQVRPSWTDVFGRELLAVGRERPDVVAVTAAMLRPTGLHPFATEFPDRIYDVGIAEQHAVASAAGLAMGGSHPVVCVYATFLNRAFDQVLLDVALHRLPVTFVLDRAGVTGTDGPSHNGMWDLSLLGVVPGMRVAAPRDAEQMRLLLREALDHADGPTAVRFPKAEAGAEIEAAGRIGGADLLRADPDADVLIVAVGPLAGAALEAAEDLASAGIRSAVADPRWILPVDPALVLAAARHRCVVTVEDNGVAGGFGDAFTRVVQDTGTNTPVRVLGLAQEFLPHGERRELLAKHRLDGAGIAAAARAALAATIPGGRPARRGPVPGNDFSATTTGKRPVVHHSFSRLSR